MKYQCFHRIQKRMAWPILFGLFSSCLHRRFEAAARLKLYACNSISNVLDDVEDRSPI